MINEESKVPKVSPEMTVLDILHRYPETEAVFRRYDERAGVCICCQALFKTLEELAEKYQLNLDQILKDLNETISL